MVTSFNGGGLSGFIFLEELASYVDLLMTNITLIDGNLIERPLFGNISDHYITSDRKQLGLLISTENMDRIEIWQILQ